ncbi:MAG: hypothetical protein ACYC9M_05145 [Desulfobulbaceae bacterium]
MFRYTFNRRDRYINLSIAPAGADAALVIAVAYVIQVQSAAWYVRLADTVFGAPETVQE